MKQTSFRLEDADVELLEWIAEERGVSKSDAIRFALHEAEAAMNRFKFKAPNKAKDETGLAPMLIEQLAHKDDQIDSLFRLLSKCHQLLDNEQRLHLATMTNGETDTF